MRRYYLIFILFYLSFVSAYADPYYEVRQGKMAFRPKKKSYAFSMGHRFKEEGAGLDLSVTQEFSSSAHMATTARGMMVYRNDSGFYAGVGPGVTHFMNSPPQDGGRWEHLQAVTMEGVVGYDLPHMGRVKPSLQLNVSQPLHVMHSTFKKPVQKSPAVSFGLKFKY
jgi:hypothetical protein